MYLEHMSMCLLLITANGIHVVESNDACGKRTEQGAVLNVCTDSHAIDVLDNVYYLDTAAVPGGIAVCVCHVNVRRSPREMWHLPNLYLSLVQGSDISKQSFTINDKEINIGSRNVFTRTFTENVLIVYRGEIDHTNERACLAISTLDNAPFNMTCSSAKIEESRIIDHDSTSTNGPSSFTTLRNYTYSTIRNEPETNLSDQITHAAVTNLQEHEPVMANTSLPNSYSVTNYNHASNSMSVRNVTKSGVTNENQQSEVGDNNSMLEGGMIGVSGCFLLFGATVGIIYVHRQRIQRQKKNDEQGKCNVDPEDIYPYAQVIYRQSDTRSIITFDGVQYEELQSMSGHPYCLAEGNCSHCTVDITNGTDQGNIDMPVSKVGDYLTPV